MEGFFLHRKHGPNLNVLQTGTATRGRCQFAVGEPRHIFLHIFLLRLPSCCLSCVHSAQHLSYSYLPGLQRAPRDGAFHSAERDPGAVSWGSSMNRTCVYPLGCAASSCSYQHNLHMALAGLGVNQLFFMGGDRKSVSFGLAAVAVMLNLCLGMQGKD